LWLAIDPTKPIRPQIETDASTGFPVTRAA
jgi:hypothetical protein